MIPTHHFLNVSCVAVNVGDNSAGTGHQTVGNDHCKAFSDLKAIVTRDDHAPSRTISLDSFLSQSRRGLYSSVNSLWRCFSSLGSASIKAFISPIYGVRKKRHTFVAEFQTCFGDILERHLPIRQRGISSNHLTHRTGRHILPLLQILHEDFIQGLAEEEDFVPAGMKLLYKDALSEVRFRLAHIGQVEDLLYKQTSAFDILD